MAKCTGCEHPNAYVGTLFVECPNEKCSFYTERSRKEYSEHLLKLERERWQKREEKRKLEDRNKLAEARSNKKGYDTWEMAKPSSSSLTSPDKTPTYPWGAHNLPLPEFSTDKSDDGEEDVSAYGKDIKPLG